MENEIKKIPPVNPIDKTDLDPKRKQKPLPRRQIKPKAKKPENLEEPPDTTETEYTTYGPVETPDGMTIKKTKFTPPPPPKK